MTASACSWVQNAALLLYHMRACALPVLATWVIRSGNRHFENGIPFLYRLQMQEGEGKISSRHYILMLSG